MARVSKKGIAAQKTPAPTPAVDPQPLPEKVLDVPLTDDLTFRKLKGRGISVVYFGYVDCFACPRAWEFMNALTQKYRGKPVYLLGVNWKETREKIEAYRTDNGEYGPHRRGNYRLYTSVHAPRYPMILLDSTGRAKKIRDGFQFRGAPALFVIDSEGRSMGPFRVDDKNNSKTIAIIDGSLAQLQKQAKK